MYRTIFLCICFIQLGICWEIIFDRVRIVFQDPAYINAYANITRYNKTTYALQGNGDLVQDLPCNAKVDIKLFGFFSNVYKELPARVVRTLKNIFQFEYKFIAAEIRKNTNLPEDCPLKKGHYYIHEFTPNFNELKKRCPVIPWDTTEYLFDYKVVLENKSILKVNIYIKISKTDEYITK